jgi:cobaltochelatase CobS
VEHLDFGGIHLAVAPDSGDPRAAAFVPEWDETMILDPKVEALIALSIDLDTPLLMVGPTGCGKTRTLCNMAAALNTPLRRINLHGDVRMADLLGERSLEVDPETGQAVVCWRDGVVADCKRNGWWLLLDELDACPSNIAFVLQALLEPGHPLTLTGNAGEVVEQEGDGPGFRIFATANTLGRGDSAGIYHGTQALNEAFLDRFFVAAVSYPAPEKERELLAKIGVIMPTAAKMVEAAGLIRAGFDRGETLVTLSTRRLVAWATVSSRLERAGAKGHTATGFAATIGNKLAAEDRQYVDGVIQRVFGRGW